MKQDYEESSEIGIDDRNIQVTRHTDSLDKEGLEDDDEEPMCLNDGMAKPGVRNAPKRRLDLSSVSESSTQGSKENITWQ